MYDSFKKKFHFKTLKSLTKLLHVGCVNKELMQATSHNQVGKL